MTTWVDDLSDYSRAACLARYISDDEDEGAPVGWECPHCLRSFDAAFPWEDEQTGRLGVVCPGCGRVAWDDDDDA